MIRLPYFRINLNYSISSHVSKPEIVLMLVKYEKIVVPLCVLPDLKLLCVDPWTKYSRSVGDERAEQHYKVAAKVLSPYNATLMRMTSMEAVKEIPNDSLDFVYIDGLHDFDSVILDLIHWTPKVRIGGIVSGHDYIHHFEGGVIQAVNAYTYAHNIHSWYITKGEPLPSFYWVR